MVNWVYLIQFLENHLINLTDYLVFENYNKKNLCDIQKDNKDILEKEYYIYNGKKEGEYKEYHINGTLRTIGNYVNDEMVLINLI